MLDRSAAPEGGPPERQPIFNVPASVVAVLAVLVAVHVGRQVLPAGWDEALFTHLAFVPGRLSYWFEPGRVVDALVAVARRGADGYRQAQDDRFFLGTGTPQPWTTVGYALLHADTAHILLNGVWLLAFGTPVARRFGPWRFLALLAVTAWAGAVAYWAAHPLDLIPIIGASAAVSGCMGAALRFSFRPTFAAADLLAADAHARRQADARSAPPLRDVLRNRRALAFLVAWFATNLVFGLGSLPLGLASGPIAWEAHIGGFLAGLLLFPLLDPVRHGGSEAAPSPPPRDAAEP